MTIPAPVCGRTAAQSAAVIPVCHSPPLMPDRRSRFPTFPDRAGSLRIIRGGARARRRRHYRALRGSDGGQGPASDGFAASAKPLGTLRAAPQTPRPLARRSGGQRESRALPHPPSGRDTRPGGALAAPACPRLPAGLAGRRRADARTAALWRPCRRPSFTTALWGARSVGPAPALRPRARLFRSAGTVRAQGRSDWRRTADGRHFAGRGALNARHRRAHWGTSLEMRP